MLISDGELMLNSISVFLPAYNEEENIAEIVTDADALLNGFTKNYEIIIIDDGSTDRTGKLADELSNKNEHIRVIHHGNNKGYGVTLRTGLKNSKYELVFYTDADKQFDIKELKKLLPFISDYDLVIGYRLNRKDPFMRLVTSKIFNLLVQILLKLNVKDVDCGFKLCKKKILNKIQLTSQRSTDVELLSKAKQLGFKIKEVGVNHYPRKKGKSEASFGFVHFVKPRIIITSLKELFYLKSELKKIK